MKTALGVVALSLLSGVATAGPVYSRFSISGTPGNWELDFEVRNNLTSDTMDLYLFGVELSGRNIVGSPPVYDPNAIVSWNNSTYGGSDTTYNNVWLDTSGAYASLMPGKHLSGFKVLVSDLEAPWEVKFFAFAYGFGDTYLGSDYFYSPQNPGFEGTAYIPAPASLAVMGLAGVFALRRRR